MTPDVVVIDSGGANIASLLYALQRLGARAELSVDAARIRTASHVLLPGVGAAHDTMQRLNGNGLAALIPTLTQPVLGICLGMQLLYSASSEAASGSTATRGLGIVAGEVERLRASPDQPVPHMGWNQLELLADDPLFNGIAAGTYFYFVHSYAAPLSADTLAACEYDGRFTAVVRRDNFRGVQFHPERSAGAGARLLANFIALQE
ncbi:MAG: imidazole glycerol phosphate synthase subunit HisH [Steroidobacteraceae bacterium]